MAISNSYHKSAINPHGNPHFPMDKSTISTGPFSIAIPDITRPGMCYVWSSRFGVIRSCCQYEVRHPISWWTLTHL